MSKNIKILLIGKKSFISQNLNFYLKNKIKIEIFSYEDFKKLNNNKLKNFNFICNCSINKNYANKKYKLKNDIDLKIAKKILKTKIKYIFLSSRKIYKSKANIKENSLKTPLDNYSKNKFKTEKKLYQLLKKKLLILRISNLIGKIYNHDQNRKISKTFIYNFYKLKRKKIIYYENHFKDFLSTKQFSYIFFKILQKNLNGIYNVSLGKKVYISEILYALTKFNKNKKCVQIPIQKNDSFYLNNKKLLKKIKIKLFKKDLLNYCYKI